MSKKNIINALLNYSNIAVFEKREKNFSSEKENNYRTFKMFKNNQIKKKKLSISKSNILFPFCQTMTSFHSLDKSSSVLPLLSFFENENSKTKIKITKKKLKYYIISLLYCLDPLVSIFPNFRLLSKQFCTSFKQKKYDVLFKIYTSYFL